MAGFQNKLTEIVLKLYEIEALKFGMFKMKVGIDSPVYFDMRSAVSYPEILGSLSELLWEITAQEIECDLICGVPYTALPIATIISSVSKIPMLIRRKEAKKYGTKKLIEGKFKPGDKCVIVEDVVTSGSSILETVKDLRSEGLNVTCAVVVVDREQGGKHNLSEQGINMKSLCSLTQILQILREAGHVNDEMVDNVKKYLAASQIRPDGTFLVAQPQREVGQSSRLNMSFASRAKQTKNPVASKLFSIMEAKKSNLCIAADVTSASKLISLAQNVGPYICLFKTHIDAVEDFSPQLVKDLVNAARKHNFLLMEDRKFADIGHTVNLQYSQGMYKISSWADFVTVHPVPGEGVLVGLKSAVPEVQRGCFLVVEMSSSGNFNNADYISSSIEMCEKHMDFVGGVVCQKPGIVQNPGLIQLTPGVSLDCQDDGHLGQQYNSPENVILSQGADIAVVGRGITQAPDPVEAAKTFCAKLWEAYKMRISSSA